MSLYEILLNFYIYGFFGWCAEVAFAAVKEKKFVNRGFLNGPICPIYGIGVTAVIGVLTPYRSSLPVLYLLSVILVTFLEWITGFLLEKLFHHRWWDYSRMPLNIGGYVCVLFSLIWGVCCVAIVLFIHPAVAAVYSLLPYWTGWLLIALFSMVTAADLYVTVSNILRFNRTLAQMEAIGAELHRISDLLGENIYRNMKEGMELQELVKIKAAQTAEDMRTKAEQTAEDVRMKAEQTAESVRVRAAQTAESVRSKAGQTAEDVRMKAEQTAESVRVRAAQTAEDVRIKAEQTASELRARYQSLKDRYQESAESLSPVMRRLLKAFPLLKPSSYETQFAEPKTDDREKEPSVQTENQERERDYDEQ